VALDVCQANIHVHKIYWFSPDDLNPFARVFAPQREFFMQQQLRFQGLAQFGVIVDDEDLVYLRYFPRALTKV
jgi:hypothetical protein